MYPRFRPLLRLFALLAWLPSAPLLAQPFVDLVDFPRNEANWDRFYSLEAHLANRFDAVCADTLCEGDYSNLRALQLRCSVNAASGQVHACNWLFIASELQVAPDTGVVLVDNRRWDCPLPLGTGVGVEAFHASLERADALDVVLPGAALSIGEAVGGCLQQVRQPERAASAARYVDARDYPGQGQGGTRFRALEQALVRGFDDVCGDTFCEGEYYNLQAMRLRCSVHAASGRVGECRWTFAGSNMDVDAATGAVTVDARDWACRLPLAAQTPLPRLLATLQGPEAIDTVLPGTATTVYEGLTTCL
ncbi:hypothetical protein [Stenotrophomonas rhizophila]|uniref:hypothetical protein n=1 Tax=Stenotrophomonas rhizophila TaxID=216778 RepID=UPI000AAB3D99|nr:hypothetical protein [Stenotrophomonas rhizophila]